MTKRVIEPELLDHAEPEEARRNLDDLVRLNERFGGHGVLAKLMARVAKPQDEFSLLDVGAASGDTGRFLKAKYPLAVVTSLDANPVNAAAANHPKLLADAFALPFGADSFDYVLCSLFLHHFSNEEIVGLLRSFYAVARKAVLINDLERHIISYCFLPATKLLFGWHRLTVHDGSVSVRAAFRPNELRGLAKAAGMGELEVQVHRPAFRLSGVARKI